MKYTMTPNQARVLGSLIEKSITTPEYYPLSLNALTNACNQKSSREPVTNFSDTEVQSLCLNLQEKNVVVKESSSRTIKYKHRFFNTEFGELKLSDDQIAVVCVMLLRGNQSAGELKTRCQRLFEFQSNEEVEQTLTSLNEHSLGPFVKELPRESGKRDSRWAHLFVQNFTDQTSDSLDNEPDNTIQEQKTSSVVQPQISKVEHSPSSAQFDVMAEITALKEEIAFLKSEISALKGGNS